MTRLYKKVTLCGVLYIHTKQVSSEHQRRVMITSFHPSTTAAWQLAILEDSSTAMSTRVAFVECANTYLLQGMSAGSGAARTVAMTVVITMRTALSCILNATMFSRVGVSISRKRSHIKDALTSFYAGEGGKDDAGDRSLVRAPFMFLQFASDLPKIGPTQRAANCATARQPCFRLQRICRQSRVHGEVPSGHAQRPSGGFYSSSAAHHHQHDVKHTGSLDLALSPTYGTERRRCHPGPYF